MRTTTAPTPRPWPGTIPTWRFLGRSRIQSFQSEIAPIAACASWSRLVRSQQHNGNGRLSVAAVGKTPLSRQPSQLGGCIGGACPARGASSIRAPLATPRLEQYGEQGGAAPLKQRGLGGSLATNRTCPAGRTIGSNRQL